MNRRLFLGMLASTPALLLPKAPSSLGFVGYPRILTSPLIFNEHAKAVKIDSINWITSGYEPPFNLKFRKCVGRKQLKRMLQTGDFKWPT